MSKETVCSVGDTGDMDLILGLGSSPGGGHSSPLQYSCLDNLMDRGAWRATVHRSQELDTNEATEHSTCNAAFKKKKKKGKKKKARSVR